MMLRAEARWLRVRKHLWNKTKMPAVKFSFRPGPAAKPRWKPAGSLAQPARPFSRMPTSAGCLTWGPKLPDIVPV